MPLETLPGTLRKHVVETGIDLLQQILMIFSQETIGNHLISRYKVVISVCLFLCPIITLEPLDRFASNLDWGTRKNHTNVLTLVLGNAGFPSLLKIIFIHIHIRLQRGGVQKSIPPFYQNLGVEPDVPLIHASK